MDDLVPAVSIGTAAAIAASAGLAYYCLTSQEEPAHTVVPVDDQSVAVDGNPHMRASKLVPPGTFVEHIYEDTKTLYESFQRGLRESKNGPCLGYRPGGKGAYQWISYEEMFERASYIGSALLHKGLKAENSTCVGVFSKNRPEWIITEVGLYSYSMVVVPIYDTLGKEACSHIISQAEISAVICDRNEQASILVKLADSTPVLKYIIIMDQASDELLAECKKAEIELVQFDDMLKLGKEHYIPVKPSKPDDIATICYTSGTTGTPKGVMLTHKNVIAAVSATKMQITLDVGPRKDDCMISFLPLSHMLERCCETAVYMEGGKVGFYSGDIRKLNEDMQALQPTCAAVVPRLLNRINDTVHNKVKGSWLKQNILNVAVWFKERDLYNRVITKSTFWDRLIFKKVQAQMGGHMRFMIVGSAPLSPKVLKFCRVALGCSLMEGYGQTECVAPCAINIHGDISPDDMEGTSGHVGPPIPCSMIKLCDVPEMDLQVDRDGLGEICVKGSNIFQGYFKEPEKTKEVLDDEGWLHTGDVGLWSRNGCLRIVDRKKHIFKLSQGEYIAPEKIESVYVKNAFVNQIFIYGDSLKSVLIGIFVPEESVLLRWASKEAIEGDFAELCKNPKIKQMVLKEMEAEGKAAGLHSFEQVKDLLIIPEPFSIENDMLTPTLKTKRNVIKKNFKKQLDDLYSKYD